MSDGLKRRVNNTIVAIGTSTGGPRALQRILQDLPEDFLAPIVIVQHMPKGFTKSLAERLNNNCRLRVNEAVHGEVIDPGNVYLAPGGFHMKLKRVGTKTFIELTKEALYMGHRPSVNLLFQSLAELPYTEKIAVVLTGMGKDGAEGIAQIKERDTNAIIIAESKKSAVIDGMPKAAIDTGLTTDIIHLHDIGTSLTKIINGR